MSEKHNTTFVFLEGRARQFVLDHSLEGPTYQHALRKEAKGKRPPGITIDLFRRFDAVFIVIHIIYLVRANCARSPFVRGVYLCS